MKRFLMTLLVAFLAGSISAATNSTKITEPNPLSFQKLDQTGEFIVWFTQVSLQNPDYCYELGGYMLGSDLQSQLIPVSRLYYKGNLVDEHINKDIINYDYYMLDFEKASLDHPDTDELLVLLTYGEFCGAGTARVLIGHVGNKLIKELVIEDIFSDEEINGIVVKQRFDVVDNLLVVKTNKSYRFVEQSPKVVKNFYDVVKPYKLVSNEFYALQSEIKKELYVKSPKGLNVRRAPFLDGRKAGKLDYAMKVKVIEETDLTLSLLENGQEIIGRWLEIENDLTDDGLPLYIFDAYLTSNQPEK